MSWWTLLTVLAVHVGLSSTRQTTLSTETRVSSTNLATSEMTTDETTRVSSITRSQPSIFQSPRDVSSDDDNAKIADEMAVSSDDHLNWRAVTEFPMKNMTSIRVPKNISDDENESVLASPTDGIVSDTSQMPLAEITNIFQDVTKDDKQIITAEKLSETNDRNETVSAIVPLLGVTCLNLSQSRREKKGNETFDNLKRNQSEDFIIVCPEQSLQNTTKSPTNSTVYSSGTYDDLFGSVVLTFVGFVVMMLNGVVVKICWDQNLRKNTYLNLVLGLSVNDINLGLTTFIYGIQLIFRLLGSLELCIVMTVMALSCLTISIYQSFCISLHRFLVITNSKWSKIIFKGKRKFVLCLTGWFAMSGSFAALVSPTNYDNNHCYHAVVYGGNLEIARWFYTLIMGSVMFGTMFFYCRAMYSLKVRYFSMSKDFLKSSNSQKKNDKGSTSRKKIIDSMKMVSILLLALYLFSGPLAVLTILDISHDENKEIFFIAFAFAVLNSLINPIIYYFNIEEFQQALRELFCNSPKTERKRSNETAET